MKIIIPNLIEKNKIHKGQYEYEELDEILASIAETSRDNVQFATSDCSKTILKSKIHPLIQATHIAYADHLALVLTPDSIWHCISNAFAIFLNEHADGLENTFIDSKNRIEISQDEFIKGGKNPWNEVIDEFIQKIKIYTNDIIELLAAEFTTTNKIAHLTSQIVLMDSLQVHFEYGLSTMCGIPEIRLAGEKKDWEYIRVRANELLNIIPEFKDWIESLDGVLDHFINAYDNKIDKSFWNQIYKR